MRTTLNIVVPCNNEEEVFSETTQRISEIISKLLFSKSISEGAILFTDSLARLSMYYELKKSEIRKIN